MTEKETKLQMLAIGRDSLIMAILALKIDYDVNHLEDLRDLLNRHIAEMNMEER